ncbi:hypothetical protein [Streptomyces sp. NPDC088752]|uniref:hypothetical protein n=1 Tax=Streptomyces sp. NPDC088752 TaxID=3154963 RepID=UPI00342E9BD8
MGRPSKKDQFIEQVKDLYTREKKSLGEIRAITGVSQQTLSRWLQEDGVEIEPRPRNANEGRTPEQQAVINARVSASRRGKGTRPRVTRTDRICCHCETPFPPSTAEQEYCGRSCARASEGEAKTKRLQAEYAQDPKRCPCGEPIPYEKRNWAKYCGSDCRKGHGSYREKDPKNYLTFTCLGCAKEVTRLKRYSAYAKYCSNPCARRHTKTKQHIVVDDAVVLDSSYEAFLWGICGILKVQISRYDRSNGVAWNDDGWYAPDFLVSCHGRQVAVETKGFEDPEDEERWAAFQAQSGIPLVVLTRKELVPLPATREELLARLGLI